MRAAEEAEGGADRPPGGAPGKECAASAPRRGAATTRPTIPGPRDQRRGMTGVVVAAHLGPEGRSAGRSCSRGSGRAPVARSEAAREGWRERLRERPSRRARRPRSWSTTAPKLELCGCGLLGVGIWLSVSQGNFATFSPSFPSLSAANLVIAIGTIIMVTGFLGCLGAIKENKCLLLSFFIVLLIILLAELILLILFFVYMDKVNENAKQDLKEGLKLYNTENNVGLKNAWNIIQAEMHCCGVTDYKDWYLVLGENTVPDRCCIENSEDCGRNSTNMNLVWKTGCYEKVKMWFDGNKHILGTAGMCILIMQILGMAFSMTLFQQIHRTGKKYDA
ncbi:tetraspanin-9 isoform X2 [Podarcis raffonei]|uniref:tetraspanin-9 isoform X2 n=1 Tax=Podarcis raffonei TaxID=65483 RepID=UPI002329142E|nr:tetraspanin-9 isoform X2 [Podarcis raffonei]